MRCALRVRLVQPTACCLSIAGRDKRRLDLAAFVEYEGTTRRKSAARGQRAIQVWHAASNSVQAFFFVRLQFGNARQKRLRVWMLGRFEKRENIRFFDNLAHVHHDDAVSHLRDDPQIVSDQSDG